MNLPDDQDLRKRFESLRERDRAGAPPFNRLAAAKSASRRWFLRIAAAPVMTMVLVLLLRTRHATPPDPGVISGWQSPTAFLMETPGSRWLGEVPKVEPWIPGEKRAK